MKLPRPVRYLAALDVFEGALMRESAIRMSHGAGPDEPLPPGSGFRAETELLGSRMVNLAKCTGAVTCRLSGIDAAYRLITNTEFPE